MAKQVVVFHQTGCGPCEEYLPRFKKLAAAYKGRMPIQQVNISRSEKRLQDTAIKFGIDATPTTLVVDEHDKVLRRKVGGLGDAEIGRLLEFAAK